VSNLPPMPWIYTTNAPEGQHEGKGFVYLIDANGRKIGTFWGNPDEKIATAEFVCDAIERKQAEDREVSHAGVHNAEVVGES